jgi:adenylosuccinate synthase
LQWGDEAKGKLVDILTSRHDIVVRFLGGANAGHTVVIGDQKFKLHHVPSGILNGGIMNVVTPGVVINPPVMIGEIDSLIARKIEVGDNLLLSERAHVVFPWHIAEDKALDKTKVSGESIGTTLRGIGPCYRDKVGRSFGIRMGDFYRPGFRDKINEVVEVKKRFLAGFDGELSDLLDPAKIYDEYSGYGAKLERYVGDTTSYLLDAVEAGKSLLFEGAQGSMLDIDHGTFPFVTSSNSSGVGVSSGSGVPGCWIDKVIGVIKAYSTRVGGGPFPTEQTNDIGDKIRTRGNEFGTTTGRPRRCGWFDAVAVRYAARLSGVTSLSLMMLDVFSTFSELKICTAYELDGRRITNFPFHADDLRRVKPIYETLPGWEEDITRVQSVDDLPANARAYVDRIRELIDRPVEVVSVGPARDQTIFVERELARA